MGVIAERQAEMADIFGAVRRLRLGAQDRVLHRRGERSAGEPLDQLGKVARPNGLPAGQTQPKRLQERPQYDDAVRELRAELDAWMANPRVTASSIEIDDELRERMRALGYLD